MSYATTYTAILLCQKHETPWLGKTNLHAAYTYCFVSKLDRDLLGFSWDLGQGQDQHYFRYVSIPFGIRSDPKHFDNYAKMLLYIMQNKGVSRDSLN